MTTPDKLRARYRKLVQQRNELIDDVAHWNSNHSKFERIESDTDEIDGMLEIIASQFDGGKVDGAQ